MLTLNIKTNGRVYINNEPMQYLVRESRSQNIIRFIRYGRENHVISRGKTITIDGCKVTLLTAQSSQARFGFVAPMSTVIDREEIHLQKQKDVA